MKSDFVYSQNKTVINKTYSTTNKSIQCRKTMNFENSERPNSPLHGGFRHCQTIFPTKIVKPPCYTPKVTDCFSNIQNLLCFFGKISSTKKIQHFIVILFGKNPKFFKSSKVTALEDTLEGECL